MNKIVSLAILVVGVILLAYGITASNSAGSEITEAVTGAPTDKSIWLIVLGAAGVIIGGIGTMRGGRASHS